MQSDDTAPRYFEDFSAGETFTTVEVEVTTAEIIEFARLYDPQHFHTDPESAVDSVFGAHVGSGWHTAALTMRLWLDHGPPVAGGLVGLGVERAALGPAARRRPDPRRGRGGGDRPLAQRRAPRGGAAAPAHADPSRHRGSAHGQRDTRADPGRGRLTSPPRPSGRARAAAGRAMAAAVRPHGR